MVVAVAVAVEAAAAAAVAAAAVAAAEAVASDQVALPDSLTYFEGLFLQASRCVSRSPLWSEDHLCLQTDCRELVLMCRCFCFCRSFLLRSMASVV